MRPSPRASRVRLSLLRLRPPLKQSAEWTTRSTEPLALMKLTNLAKTLASPSACASSPMSRITHFSLDLAASDSPSGALYLGVKTLADHRADYLTVAGLVLTHLRHLTTLRFVGPRRSKRALPTSFIVALANSGCRLASLGLSRISSVEGGRALDRVAEHLIELKLNSCDGPAWNSLLACMDAPINIEGLDPPEDLAWFTPRQWRSLRSLRLGHGSPSVLADVLSSALDADEQADVRPELESLILSHFDPPLGLPLLVRALLCAPLDELTRMQIRLARAFGALSRFFRRSSAHTPCTGSTSVRKLEIGSLRADIWSPRCAENLAAYFTKTVDLRIHVAPSTATAPRSRNADSSGLARGRAVACDWTADGEYDMVRSLCGSHAIAREVFHLARRGADYARRPLTLPPFPPFLCFARWN